MKQCVIFCAGEFTGLVAPVTEEDYIIAADGGLAHVRSLQLQPKCVLGDFDSLGYVPEGAAVFPVEKDDTDAMLAVRHGLQRGLRRFILYGGLDGPRLDHTLANLQTLQFLADHGARGWLVGTRWIATVLRNGTLRFPAYAKGMLSVFCMGADARGVSLSGLKYTLTEGILTAGFPLGVSNSFVGQEAAVTVGDGSLLILYDRENGLADREERR